MQYLSVLYSHILQINMIQEQKQLSILHKQIIYMQMHVWVQPETYPYSINAQTEVWISFLKKCQSVEKVNLLM